MTDIQFQEESYGQSPQVSERGLTNWLINKGIVKNSTQATWVMLGVSIVALSITFILLFSPSYQQPKVQYNTSSGVQHTP